MNRLKTGFLKAKNYVEKEWVTFKTNAPDAVKPVLSAGLIPMLLTDGVLASSASFNPANAIKLMVGYVTSILMGVGIIYALIAIFNWASAMKQEDPERQSKAITNIFVAGVLIVIKPISVAIINALGGSGTAGDYFD